MGLADGLKVGRLLFNTYSSFKFSVKELEVLEVFLMYLNSIYPPATPALIKKKIKFSSYITKFRQMRLQSYI